MDQMPLSAVIFDSIPESILIFCFGMAIVGEYIDFKKILVASIINAFATMFVRAHVSIFGLHTIIDITFLFILFWKVLNLKPWKALITSLISLTTLLLLDEIIFTSISRIQNITLEEILKDNCKRIIYPIPTFIIGGSLTWFLYSRKIFLIGGSRAGYDDNYNKARLLVALILLLQGFILSVIIEHLTYFGQYSLLIQLLSIIFFIFSILFLIFLYGCDRG